MWKSRLMSVMPVRVPPRSRLAAITKTNACWVKSGTVLQSRMAMRTSFAEPVVITPWSEIDDGPAGHSLLADGRDISPSGISFWHEDSLPYRAVAISYRGTERDDDEQWFVETLLVRLLWCRFGKNGRYLSGGRIEKMIEYEFGRPLVVLLGDESLKTLVSTPTHRHAERFSKEP